MTVKSNGEIIEYVSKLLNDQYPGNEFIRWPRELVSDALFEALGVVALFRPDLAITTVEMELQPGAIQKAPEGCSKIASVLGQVDTRTGTVLVMAEEADNELAKWFPNVCSPSGGGYTLGSFSMNDSDNSIFIVSPPVMPGQTASVLIQCVGGCADGSVDCQYLTPVVEFMMYRLLSTEDDSASSPAAAQAHLRTFTNVLALNFRLVQEYMEGRSNAPAAEQSEA